jgi:hypothetical protein
MNWKVKSRYLYLLGLCLRLPFVSLKDFQSCAAIYHILPYFVAFHKALLHKEFIDLSINQWPRDGLASKLGLSVTGSGFRTCNRNLSIQPQRQNQRKN